jgi:glycosyltransferase involved in cell wall biosynthesis
LRPAQTFFGQMTVLMAVHSAKPAGAQLVALGQAETLAATHELVIAIGQGELRPRFAALGPLVRAPTRLPIWGASAPRWTLELGRALPDAVRIAALVRARGVEAIVVNSSILVAPVLAARLARVPVIVHVQEAPKSRAVRLLLRFHGALADTVVAISPGIADALGAPRANVLLNPVGIDVPALPDRAPRAAGAPLALVVVGTVDRHKRQDLAIDVLGRLVAEGREARLELIGGEADADYARELRERAAAGGVADRVTFSGQRDDVPARVARADVLLLPAGEVTPLVLMEAMALGTPVVAARMGSVADVVGEDGVSGLLVAPDAPDAMAAAVARIADDPELAAGLARQGRLRVEERFDQRRSHARLRAEIDRLVAARAA